MIKDTNLIKQILEAPVYQRLREWYEIGPVQRATLDEFVEEIVIESIMVAKMNYNSGQPYGGVERALEQHWSIRHD